MAKTYKLVTTYADANGKSVTFSYDHADPTNVEEAGRLKALVEAVIENGSIFKQPPVTFKEAYLVETQKTQLDIE